MQDVRSSIHPVVIGIYDPKQNLEHVVVFYYATFKGTVMQII